MKASTTARRFRRRFFVQALEDRCTPAVIAVTNLLDSGAGSLRDAITQINLSVDPTNTIDATGVSGTITLASALPSIIKAVDIVGPGAGALTVSGNNAFQVFKLGGTGVINVSMSDLTVTAGKSTTDGGAIFSGDDALTLTRVNVTNSTSATEGGGISTGFNGLLFLESCNITGNTGTTGGGIYFPYNGRFVINNSTISNNTANGTSLVGGGGLYFFGIFKGGSSQINNTTISGNTADGGKAGTQSSGGGGICLYQVSGTLDINNCTITNNTINGILGDTAGGGISAHLNFTGDPGVINLRSSIVAGNNSPGGIYPDFFTDLNHTVISSNGAYATNPLGNGAQSFIGSFDNTAFNPALELGPLANNGGPTQTHALLAGSFAIDAGFNAAPGGTDGRGPTYTRKVGPAVDVGAFEFNSVPGIPTGNATNARLTAAGGTNFAFNVLWGDDGTINVATLGNDDLLVTGPGGYSQPATLTGTTVVNPGRVLASYTMPANSLGNATKWDGLDNGVYTISVQAGKVQDTLGNSVVADAIAQLEVQIALPTAVATAPNIQTPQLGTTTNTVTVVYKHEIPIAFSTITSNDIRVTGPNSYDKLGTLKTVVPGSDSTTITATYEIPAAGGTWDVADLGKYTISMEPNQVSDTDSIFVPAGTIGFFSVAIPTTLQVTNTNDSGPGSLRDVILALNDNVADAADTVTFSSLFNSAQTISLLGEILISDSIVINGPSGKLTLDAGGSGRHFNIDGVGAVAAKISNMTFINGAAGGDGYGGAIRLNNDEESLVITNCFFTNNTSASGGGAIGSPPAASPGGKQASLTVVGCFFENNTASGQGGGALHMNANTGGVVVGNQLNISGSVFRNNVATAFNGGAIFIRMNSTGVPAFMQIESSEFSNNINDAGFGGAIGILTGNGNMVIRNTTFHGNATKGTTGTAGGGGAISMGNGYGGTVDFTNNTVTQNVSTGTDAVNNWGGAISQTSGASKWTIESSIIFGNPSVAAPNAQVRSGAGTFSFRNSLLENKVSLINYVDLGGNLPIGTDPLLGPLANNGGFSKTALPGSGSPVRNAGSNPAGLAFDQRGSGFPRVLGGKTDIGAVESIDPVPIAQATVTDVLTGGATSYSFSVTYSDDSAIKVSTLNTGDVTVTGPGGFSVNPTFLGVDDNSDGTPRVATYSFTPPGGSWDKLDNGSYTVTMNANEVSDLVPNFVKAGTLTSFVVGVPDTFIVTNANDAGPGSLRQAVLNANALVPSLDQIVFDPTFFATAKTITLTSGPMTITDAVNIVGPGAAKVNVAGNANQIFILNGPSGFSVSMSDMTLSGATAAGDGGAVNNSTAVAAFNNMVFDSNSASANGGAIYANGGQVNVSNSTFTKNSSGASGGAVSIDGGASGSFNTVTFSANNSATGGGIGFINGALLVESSLFVNNIASADGGGIGTVANPIVGTLSGFTVRNSTFSGNEAANTGGAIQANQLGTLFLYNTTVTKSKSSLGAVYHTDNVNPPGFVNIESSIITDNITTGTEANLNFTSGLGNMVINNSAVFSVTGAFTGSGNLPLATDYKLDPNLANNGGPTQTHALLSGSPAINTGSNPASLAFDQRGPGFARTSGAGTDMGAFEVQVATPPPTVVSSLVNGGAGNQRSIVTSIKVTFSEAVTFPSGINAAFQLNRLGPGAPTGLVNTTAVQSGSDVTITFASGGAVNVDPGNSLRDGLYQLTILSSKVLGAGGSLDGDGNGTGGDDFLTSTTGIASNSNVITRLFGDNDGDRDVDAQDFGAFRAAFGGTNPVFDFDQDGDVDASDFGQFRARFGATV
jgi:predicted outer membrane repeat protein